MPTRKADRQAWKLRLLLCRFNAYWVPEPNTGCWLWYAPRKRGPLDAEGVYGHFSLNKKQIGAHRASWILHRGPIPPGLNVLHKCDTMCCVNPDHLFLGTQGDNIRDAWAKGRIKRSPREVCKNGHPFTEENIVLRRRHGVVVGRACRLCINARAKAWFAKRWGLPPPAQEEDVPGGEPSK